MKKYLALLLPLTALSAMGGSFSGAAGTSGSEAISKDSIRFLTWANGNLTPQYGTDVSESFKTPSKALGKAVGGSGDIVCLGNGGVITLYFPRAIRDGEGADFAVFENSFSDTFLELAFVDVSSDGVNFFRFPNRSEGTSVVGAFGSVDPTTLSGLAGKHRAGYGTPFDLRDLPESGLLDKMNIRFVRVVDIVGDGSVKDSSGYPIYDPTPTVGSGGFDLEAIGVLNQNEGAFEIVRSEIIASEFLLEWESNPGSEYMIETSETMNEDWEKVGDFLPSFTSGKSGVMLPLDEAPRRFWRVVRKPLTTG
ncbi:PEP-CTERM sorting domain-containing protein [Luteolibacter algae]|uniref:PEP-CTERM sorting domain-containing protein n=1 Tax=Luteolibacter algae TaxID=454151 RepID=A0ABW5D9X5_9BACT